MHYEYDATSESCPLPLVKMRLILKKMKVGDSFVLLISDKGSKNDIPKLLTKQGYIYYERQVNNNVVEIHIKKGDL